MEIAAGGSYGTFVDFDGVARSEAQLITRYRQLALQPEVDMAVDEIVNESIVSEDGEHTVEIVLDDVDKKIPPKIVQSINQEFEEAQKLLEFNMRSYDIFRKYFIDAHLYYYCIVDPKNPEAGIQQLRYIDPRKIKKVREVKKVKPDEKSGTQAVSLTRTVQEYYIYSEKGFSGNNNLQNTTFDNNASVGIKIAKDTLVHINSGLTDESGKIVLGYLNKALRPMSQLRSMEDATLIYRITRAPERRIFYVDVGSLPKAKAEQHLQDLMIKFKNKLVYDTSTGIVNDSRKFTSMTEDFWFPRRGESGGKGTEVVTLPPGQMQGILDELKFFQEKLYKSLNVPVSRLMPETLYMSGRSTEISRDEIKFSKFVDRLRNRFSQIFIEIIGKNLVLKSVLSPDDWDSIKGYVKFRYLRDNVFSEMKDSELRTERLNQLNAMMPYVGRYYSNKWVRQHVLKQDDQEMEDIDQEIVEEMQNPLYRCNNRNKK